MSNTPDERIPRRGRDTAPLRQPYRVTIASFWRVYGARNRCELCDRLIGDLDLDFEVETGRPEERESFHFHSSCYNRFAAGDSPLGTRCASILRR